MSHGRSMVCVKPETLTKLRNLKAKECERLGRFVLFDEILEGLLGSQETRAPDVSVDLERGA